MSGKIWDFSGPGSVAEMEYTEWLQWIFEHTSKENHEFAAITIWALWYDRNKLIHKGIMQQVSEVIIFIQGCGREFRAMQETLRHPSPTTVSRWSPSPSAWVKINVDTGFSGPTNKAISGFIARDDSGNIMGSGYRFHTWTSTVVMAEAAAILHDLQFACDMGFRKIILESDS